MSRALTIILLATMAALALGESPSRFAITSGQVARALSQAGTVTVAQQVSLPVRVLADGPAAALDILSIEPPAKGKPGEHAPAYSMIKLKCRRSQQCLPFYALVNWPEPSGAISRPSVVSPLAGNAADITMRAGAHATLMIDDNRSHIKVAVISLQNGMVGHRIRLASPDHKQFYFGEVVSANLLRGSF